MLLSLHACIHFDDLWIQLISLCARGYNCSSLPQLLLSFLLWEMSNQTSIPRTFLLIRVASLEETWPTSGQGNNISL